MCSLCRQSPTQSSRLNLGKARWAGLLDDLKNSKESWPSFQPGFPLAELQLGEREGQALILPQRGGVCI